MPGLSLRRWVAWVRCGVVVFSRASVIRTAASREEWSRRSWHRCSLCVWPRLLPPAWRRAVCCYGRASEGEGYGTSTVLLPLPILPPPFPSICDAFTMPPVAAGAGGVTGPSTFDKGSSARFTPKPKEALIACSKNGRNDGQQYAYEMKWAARTRRC